MVGGVVEVKDGMLGSRRSKLPKNIYPHSLSPTSHRLNWGLCSIRVHKECVTVLPGHRAQCPLLILRPSFEGETEQLEAVSWECHPNV